MYFKDLHSIVYTENVVQMNSLHVDPDSILNISKDYVLNLFYHAVCGLCKYKMYMYLQKAVHEL